jgi:phosphoenolpyruvate carboxykinase (GTP)
MAMLPFCGYNMGDYFGHWVEVGKRLKSPPRIFRVNWFRTDDKGKFIWPGFGDNLRVLQWILDRCEGKGKAIDTPVGFVPSLDGINRAGLNVSDGVMTSLLNVDPAEWIEAIEGQEGFMKSYGMRMPKSMWDQHNELAKRIKDSAGLAVNR